MLNFFYTNEKNTGISLFFSEFIYITWKTSWWYLLHITTKSEVIIDMYYKYIKNYILVITSHSPLMFDKLSDIVVYDRISMFLRFFIIYILSNSDREFKLKIRLNVNERNSVLTSISTIIYSSNWAEREAIDLFGVKFFGHEDLRRIIGDYGIWGFPGRRDYPLVGLYSYMYCLNFLRVFRIRGMFTDFWSIYFQKKIAQC